MEMIMKKEMEFHFYLDAWNYCRIQGIKKYDIVKKDFRTWILQFQQ
jgi:hypothetical protein